MPLQRGWQLMLILCIAVEVVEQAGLTNAATATSTTGKKFYFGLPRTVTQIPSPKVIVGTPSESASFMVETEGGTVFNGTATATNSVTVNLDTDLQVGSSVYTDRLKGIRVFATGEGPIFVLITMEYDNLFRTGFADYLIHPNMEFAGQSSYEYVGISTSYSGQSFEGRTSQILLIGNTDATTISITPTQTVSLPEDAQNSSSPMVTVQAGSTHNVTINRLQTLLIFHLEIDITGTKIVSTKPLTVLSGHNCAQFPSDENFCEPVFVHVPPTFTWGREYLLAAFAGRTSSQFYRLVTAEESTTIAYRCGTSEPVGSMLPSAGSGTNISLPANSYCSLISSKPIFVVQLGAGHATDNVGDPVMAIVSPISGHVDRTRFITLSSSDFSTSFISVTVQAEHFDQSQILLDGGQLSCTWQQIYNTTSDDVIGYGCSASVTEGVHNVVHSGDNGVLSVVAYGWNNSPRWGYAYLTGIHLAVAGQTTGPTVVLGDQLPFYDLSSIIGLRELPRVQDASSPPIFIPGRLVYGSRIAKTVYVNENGAFSFDKTWKFSHPERYPGTRFHLRQHQVVSPFWSDNDIRKEGTVRYVTVESGSSGLGAEIMNEATTYVREQLNGGPDFQPTWLIVAQWDRVHPDPHGAKSHEGVSEEYLNKTNTYQGLIITNITSTYAFFTYTCGEIQWSGQGFETAIVGYNSQAESFSNHPANGFQEIGEIVSCSRQVVGRRRKRANGANGAGCMLPADRMVKDLLSKCCQFADNDANLNGVLLEEINTVLQDLPQCPCTIAQMNLGTILMFIRFPGRDVDGVSECFRSNNEFIPDSPIRPVTFHTVCCYDNNGALISAGDNAGRLTAIPENDLSADDEFRQSCCTDGGGSCDKYTSRRPITPKGPPDQTKPGAGYGDPHYKTMDCLSYTFAAAGEFTLFDIRSNQNVPIFTLQGRLGPGNNWPATTTKSLAFGIPNVEAYQFVHNDQLRLIQTAGDGAMQDIISMETNNAKVSRSGSSLNAFMKKSNIELTATWYGKYMNWDIRVPRSLCQSSVGHLGSCDGNPANDIAGPNQFRITQNQTMFIYGNFGRRRRQLSGGPDFECTSFSNCGNQSFVGLSFEDLTITDSQREFCNNDTTCLYDLAITGDEEIAQTSMTFNENVTRVIEILQNSPPNITGEEIFNVTVGIENIYIFEVEDSGNYTVEIEGGAPENSLLEDNGGGMYTFRWTPSQAPTRAITFLAVDNLEEATMHSPLLHVCTCFNGGQCTLEGVPSSNQLIIPLTCLCTDAYEGDTCSEDKNGCAEVDCFGDIECLDVPAPGVGSVCGPCPSGFTGNGVKCADIDECAMNSTLCDQMCDNTFGSYMCTCHSGFRLNNVSNQCEDINECSYPVTNDCQQMCTNTEGSHMCSCETGFILNSNGMTCDPQQTCTSGNQCSHICAVIGGMEQCSCPTGFEFAIGSTTTCTDIDECDRFSPCDQNCTNTIGSFMCSCETGYELQDDDRACADIDECRMAALNDSVICINDTQCTNTLGSFKCDCVSGYKLVDGYCERFVEMAPDVESAVPSLGKANIHSFVVLTFERSELTSDRIQSFRSAASMAINRYCQAIPCTVVTSTSTQNITNLTVEPQDVAIPNSLIDDDAAGRPFITFYVQLNTTTFLAATDLFMAIQEADDLFRNAGYLPSQGAPNYTNVMTVSEVNKGDSITVSLNLERLGDNFTYFWTKNGVEFGGNGIVNLTVKSLHIASADCDDNGIYNVTATNQFGSGSLSFRLTVLCPPVFQNTSATQINVNIGQSFTINCRIIESYPPNPRITLRVSPGNTSEDITANPIQSINSVKAGDYIYTCRADNTRNTTTLAFQVQVTITSAAPVGLVIGITVAVVLLVVFIIVIMAVLVLVFCCKSSNSEKVNKNDHEMNEKE